MCTLMLVLRDVPGCLLIIFCSRLAPAPATISYWRRLMLHGASSKYTMALTSRLLCMPGEGRLNIQVGQLL
jgi:hypothetical protein